MYYVHFCDHSVADTQHGDKNKNKVSLVLTQLSLEHSAAQETRDHINRQQLSLSNSNTNVLKKIVHINSEVLRCAVKRIVETHIYVLSREAFTADKQSYVISVVHYWQTIVMTMGHVTPRHVEL